MYDFFIEIDCLGTYTQQSRQKLMTHEELFINARLLCPFPLAVLIPELRKHAMLLAYSSGNSLTPIYYSVQHCP